MSPILLSIFSVFVGAVRRAKAIVASELESFVIGEFLCLVLDGDGVCF